MRRLGPRILLLAILALAATPALARPANKVVLEVKTGEPRLARAVQDMIGARLKRFGIEVVGATWLDREQEEGAGPRLKLRLPPLTPDQPDRVLRLVTSPGRLDVVAAKNGEVVLPSSAIRGLASSLVEGRVRFRIRLKKEAAAAWKNVPTGLALRWDGREIHFFRKDAGGKPYVLFPAGYPRTDLRMLFCCVEFGPLPAPVVVVRKSLELQIDPAAAWATLVEGWIRTPPTIAGVLTFRRPEDGAVYTATTRTERRESLTFHHLEDRLQVPKKPQRGFELRVRLDSAFRLVEGRLLVGGQEVKLTPDEVFLAPGAALRLASLLPPRPGGVFGPGGRLRVRKGRRAGTIEVVSPTRPQVIVLRDGEVVGFRLAQDTGEFVLQK